MAFQCEKCNFITSNKFNYKLHLKTAKHLECKRAKRDTKYSCSTHSHNYYFELLSEAGILGLILIVAFFSIILKNSFFYFKKNYKKNDLKFYLFIPILLVFLMEIWPIRSTGSFFTTWNATFTWMIIAILSAVTLEGKKVKKSFKFGYLHFF